MARERVADGPVVASIFVNPLQFGPTEDLERYPRTLDADLKVCEREGVDIVFAPAVEEVYPGWPAQPQVTVEPGPLATVLEGRTRPGHFRGVLTVVAKLFGLVRPDLAVFGQKDYQQLVLIRRMVEDLCLAGSRGGVEIVGGETQREPTDWRCRAATATSTPPSAWRRSRSAGPCAPLRWTPSAAWTRLWERPGPSSAPPMWSTSTTWWSPPPTSASCRPTYLRAPRPASSSPPRSAAPD